MYDIVMKQAQAEQDAAAAASTCVAPTVFAARQDGYAKWSTYAATLGRATDWKPWAEDETCPQRAVAQDTIATSDATPYCSLETGGGMPSCTDAQEPNDSRETAKPAAGTIDSLQICAADDDWFKIAAGGTVRIEFTHANGDLDLAAYDANGTRVATSESTNNTEQVTVPAGGSVRVYGYNGARNAYKLVVTP